MDNKLLFLIIFILSLCMKVKSLPSGISKTSNDNYLRPEYAIQESEGLPTKPLAKYENSQSFVASFLNPQPIVDNLKEEDKYGNTGDKFVGVGRGIINGFESLSILVNRIVDKPFEITKQISRSLTSKLNDAGGIFLGR